MLDPEFPIEFVLRFKKNVWQQIKLILFDENGLIILTLRIKCVS